MNSSHLVACTLCAVILIITNPRVDAALDGRLPVTPGGTDYQAYYDDQLNITWAADVIVTGRDTWFNQAKWATTLSINGITGWRLPNVDVNGDGAIIACKNDPATDCLDNEIGYQLFKNGITPANPGPFTNFDQSGIYVSGTDFVPIPGFIWDISISLTRGIGSFGAHDKTSPAFFAWAVRDGDVHNTITIDIKPGRTTLKPVNIQKDGLLRVAIVGDATFDAHQVDPATVKFGPGKASPVQYKGRDYNHDGFSDLIIKFKLDETSIACGDTDATLTGKTFLEPVIAVQGTDSFTLKGCP